MLEMIEVPFIAMIAKNRVDLGILIFRWEELVKSVSVRNKRRVVSGGMFERELLMRNWRRDDFYAFTEWMKSQHFDFSKNVISNIIRVTGSKKVFASKYWTNIDNSNLKNLKKM